VSRIQESLHTLQELKQQVKERKVMRLFRPAGLSQCWPQISYKGMQTFSKKPHEGLKENCYE
jgi:hypothetical protein